MRSSITLMVTLLIGFVSPASPAQNSAINPLADQIREQEVAVEKAPGKNDGEAWLKLAVLCQDAAQYRDSERAYRRALALLRSKDDATLADTLDHMGTMYVERGQLAKAESLERKALAMREAEHDLLGEGISHMHLSVLLLGRRDYSSAEAEAEIAVSLLAPEQAHHAVQTEGSPEEKMTALIDLSLARCARGGCAAAVPDLRRALGIAQVHYEANSIPVGFLDFLLGYALWKSGDFDSAEKLMKNGTQELSTQLGWGHPTYLQALKQYGIFLNQAGHTTEAEEIGARIAKIEKAPGFAQVQSNRVPGGLDLR
jgi:tetratricopeptide (TPR) repeat protein